MAQLHQLLAEHLNDQNITDDDVRIIRHAIEQDGKLDLEDVKFLVELLCQAKEVCPAFDDLFFPVLKEVLLQDGRIGADEQFYLLKMLYADGHVRPRELQFLEELRREASEVSPEFEQMYETAAKSSPKNWDVGGAVVQ